MALLRPLSGSGAFAVMAEILKTHGPDSLRRHAREHAPGLDRDHLLRAHGLLRRGRASAISRHILSACLIGDLAGFAAATAACHVFFG